MTLPGRQSGIPLTSAPRTPWTRLDKMLLVLSILSTCALVGIFAYRLRPKPPPRIEVVSARGIALDSLVVNRANSSDPSAVELNTGRPRLVYLFNTSCHYCTEARQQVGAMLARLDTADYATASVEPLAVTHSYWQGVAEIPPPLSLRFDTWQAIGINAVPTLLVIGGHGRILHAFQSDFRLWRVVDARRELDRAATGE